MDIEELAPTVGVVACVALVASYLAPFVLIPDAGTGLGLYYGAGPLGAGGLVFLALLDIVVLLAGKQGRTDDAIASGLAFALGMAILAISILWATAVNVQDLYNFPAPWIVDHRWLVVAVSGLVPASAAAYAYAVLNR
ncbi:MAG: DUF7548 family protein [Halobacteriota archaeon]